MNLQIGPDELKNIAEIWEVSPNTVEVVMSTSHKRIRIRAKRKVRSESTAAFAAEYEEECEVMAGLRAFDVWVAAYPEYPWQDGASAEACVRAALRWVNDQNR